MGDERFLALIFAPVVSLVFLGIDLREHMQGIPKDLQHFDSSLLPPIFKEGTENPSALEIVAYAKRTGDDFRARRNRYPSGD